MRLFKCGVQGINAHSVRYVFARDMQAAKQKMARKSLIVTHIHEVRFFTQQGTQSQELEGIFWQLGFGYASGLPLLTLLQSMKEGLYFQENIALAQSLMDALERGNTLSSALQQHTNICSHLVIAIFGIGEQSGLLQEACELCAKEIARRNEYTQALRQAMIYPCLLMLSFVCVCFILALFVIPEFAQIYQELGASLPLSTQIILESCAFLQSHAALIALCVGALLLLCAALLRRKRVRDYIMIHAPLLRHIITDYQLSIYFLGLHYFLKSKIPFATSIERCNMLLGNTIVRQHFAPMTTMIHNGMPLSEALSALPLQIANIALIQSGEQSGMLDRVLEFNAAFYKKRFTQALQTLQALAQPLATMLIGIAIALLAYSIVAPMWQLLDVAL